MNVQNRKRRPLFVYVVAFLFSMIMIVMGISVGSQAILPSEVMKIFNAYFFDIGSVDPIHAQIVIDIRLPRTLLAFLVGAALSAAGVAFQGFLRNPLADPYTLGVSSGAALGAVIVIFFQLSIPLLGNFTLPTISIGSGLLTLLFLLWFARALRRSLSAETIILIGIIISAFLGACLSLFIALAGEELRQAIQWLLGSVGMRGWDYVYLMIPFFLFGTILIASCLKELNAFAFGQDFARHIGVSVQKRGVVILIGAAILTGTAVAVAGTIGFVGLVVPHFVRMLIGPNHVHLLPVSMLTGGGFLIAADISARTLLAPMELPLGVITAIIGAPIFAYLLFVQQRRKN
ncbi:iron complex transport system permease protein [Geomicrobium halophilum]|uniref:Iron complex transport system permease protein n=1 Tax=Geomicrobium halophilum TaxID=549000 RepID=A0A841PJU6_9BACL|nr:iron ABC transporter permease [Geomicrobium halophilum]MBB6448999.1 iron complex transport system permease protein [Geomicrobium halophilum]